MSGSQVWRRSELRKWHGNDAAFRSVNAKQVHGIDKRRNSCDKTVTNSDPNHAERSCYALDVWPAGLGKEAPLNLALSWVPQV